jgi:hypothetical protein
MKGPKAMPVTSESVELIRRHRLAQDRRGNLLSSMDKRET